MADNVTTRTNVGVATTGYSGLGQNHSVAGSQELATLSTSIDKGGMRGIGLVLVMIAEMVLKNKATNLAKDYYNTNKKDYDFFTSTHQVPMAQSVAEAMSPIDNPVYYHDFYASAPAGMGKSAVLDKQWFEARRRAHRYAIGAQKRLDYDFARMRVHGVVGGWNVGRRYEITYADEHNNRRFDRKVEVANIGIGVGNIVRQGLASASSNLSSAYDNLGDTVSTIGNGLAAHTGYKAGRMDTGQRYNPRKDAGTQNSKEFSKD